MPLDHLHEQPMKNKTVIRRVGCFVLIGFACAAAISILIVKLKLRSNEGVNETTGFFDINNTTILSQITQNTIDTIQLTTKRTLVNVTTTLTNVYIDQSKTSISDLTSYWIRDAFFIRGRSNYDAVPLANDKIIACGGQVNSSTVTPTCEIYSSTTGWISGCSMNADRYNHVLTLFENNTKVLATGSKLPAYQQTAEVYDISANKWTFTMSNMTTTRRSHTATLLRNGQILLCGGKNASLSILSTAELFSPSTNLFTDTTSMISGRCYFTSTLLSDGSTVLVTGGANSSSIMIATAEIYRSGSWTITRNTMKQQRAYHAAVLLNDGNVLIAGGGNGDSVSYSTVEIYNTSTDTFISVGPMQYRRALFTLTLLPSGHVLASGGVDWSTGTYPVICEIYDPTTQSWSTTRMLNDGRSAHRTILLSDSILIMGGYNGENERLRTCEKYKL